MRRERAAFVIFLIFYDCICYKRNPSVHCRRGRNSFSCARVKGVFRAEGALLCRYGSQPCCLVARSGGSLLIVRGGCSKDVRAARIPEFGSEHMLGPEGADAVPASLHQAQRAYLVAIS